MKTRSWIRNLFATRNRGPVRKPPYRRRLMLEALEDRMVLSTFTVNSTGDSGTGSGTTGDLRYCITQANAAGGTNTIDFSVSTCTTIRLNSALPTCSSPYSTSTE